MPLPGTLRWGSCTAGSFSLSLLRHLHVGAFAAAAPVLSVSPLGVENEWTATAGAIPVPVSVTAVPVTLPVYPGATPIGQYYTIYTHVADSYYVCVMIA